MPDADEAIVNAGLIAPHDDVPSPTMPPSVQSLSHHFTRLLHCMAVALLAAVAVHPSTARADASFLSPAQAFRLDVKPPAPDGRAMLHWDIAPGYYLYRDRIQATATPNTSVALDKPPGERKNDPNFGAMDVYHGALDVGIPASAARRITVTWQGCAEAGLCYPPQTREVVLDGTGAHDVSPTTPADASSATPALMDAATGSDSAILGLLNSRSLVWTLPLFFMLGIALAFTPCVLPMVPIVSSIVVGNEATSRRAFALSLAFVMPMAVTYAALGVAAAGAGANLQALLQNRVALWSFGAVFVVLALSMFGFFELQLPEFLRSRLDAASRKNRGGTLLGAAGMGTVSALLVGPCMTAPLAGTLLYIAQSGNALQGGLLLLALGLGMGVPLLVVGTLGAKYLPRPGAWMDRVKGAFGFILLGTAIWMVQRVTPEVITLALWGIWLVSLALTIRHLRGAGPTVGGAGGARRAVLLGSTAVVAGLWGCAMILGAAAGATDPLRPLPLGIAKTAAPGESGSGTVQAAFQSVGNIDDLQARVASAAAAGQPVLVDFSADWCVSCKSIDREVFGSSEVQHALAGTLLLRADVTANSPPQLALMRAHQIIGPPTVMLFDAKGRESRVDRLVGEFGAQELIRRQAVVRGQS